MESQPGKGTTFRFTIKAEEAHPDPELQRVTNVSPRLDPLFAARFPLQILLCEDNAINRKLVLKILERMGYNNTDIAENGGLAVSACESKQYDIILMDLHMPVLNGLEATREIRRRRSPTSGPAPWIIALTASVLHGDHERCLSAGMDDYISKPINLLSIQKAIIAWKKQGL